MRMEVIHGSRVVPKAEQQALLAGVSDRIRDRNEMRIQQATAVRRSHHLALEHERDSVKRAMLAIEQRLVEALWVLARLPTKGARGFSNRNGIDYMLDKVDQYANAVANGGKWDLPPEKPPVPSGKAIDAMYDPLEWLSWLGRLDGKMVAAAAASRRGQMRANIRWQWVKTQVPEMADMSSRTLEYRYKNALRDLVAELTFRKAANALAD